MLFNLKNVSYAQFFFFFSPNISMTVLEVCSRQSHKLALLGFTVVPSLQFHVTKQRKHFVF